MSLNEGEGQSSFEGQERNNNNRGGNLFSVSSAPDPKEADNKFKEIEDKMRNEMLHLFGIHATKMDEIETRMGKFETVLDRIDKNTKHLGTHNNNDPNTNFVSGAPHNSGYYSPVDDNRTTIRLESPSPTGPQSRRDINAANTDRSLCSNDLRASQREEIESPGGNYRADTHASTNHRAEMEDSTPHTKLMSDITKNCLTEKFSGLETDEELTSNRNVMTWALNIHAVVEQHGAHLPNNMKIAICTRFLTGAAKDWFSTERRLQSGKCSEIGVNSILYTIR
jgi:hypothetical protein